MGNFDGQFYYLKSYQYDSRALEVLERSNNIINNQTLQLQYKVVFL